MLPRGNVHTGAVQIAATIDDEGMRLFDAELERVSTDGKQETRTLVLHVTDPELLARTGGIVQGMSGCPILQDGKLVGAVTHVFVASVSVPLIGRCSSLFIMVAVSNEIACSSL